MSSRLAAAHSTGVIWKRCQCLDIVSCSVCRKREQDWRRRHGWPALPPLIARSKEELFWEKVDKFGPIPEHRPELGPCWQWLAAFDKNGYGKFNQGFGTDRAPRIAYELVKGPIPVGLTLDHLCLNVKCVNPDHLDPVPLKENVLRGQNFTAIQARKTHCLRGHIFDEENTYLWRGHRYCKTCRDRRRKRTI